MEYFTDELSTYEHHHVNGGGSFRSVFPRFYDWGKNFMSDIKDQKLQQGLPKSSIP